MRMLKQVNKKSARLIALALAALLSCAMWMTGVRRPEVYAESSKVTSLKQDLAEVQKSLKDVKDKRAALARQQEQLSGDLAFLQNRSKEQRAVYDAALQQKQFALMTLEQDREACLQAREDFETKQTEYCERVAQMYEWRQKSVLEILLTSGNLEGILSTFRFMKMVTDADEEALDELNAAQALAELTQENAEENYQTAVGLLEEAERVLQNFQNEEWLKAQSLDAIKSQLTNYRQQQEQLQKDVSAAQKKLDDQRALEEEEARRKAAAANTPAKPVTPAYPTYAGTGMFLWPVPGSYFVTSNFGWRPIFGRFHDGVDIGAAIGTPVVAMASGLVTAVSYNGISGNYIYVDHQNGYVTRYYHLSGFACYPGQSVRAGQIIGYVGSTGRSTGPHLHFEVRANGQPLNGLLFFRAR